MFGACARATVETADVVLDLEPDLRSKVDAVAIERLSNDPRLERHSAALRMRVAPLPKEDVVVLAARRAGISRISKGVKISLLGKEIGEGGLGSSYFHFQGSASKDPDSGFIGFTNGMCNLDHAMTRKNVTKLSRDFADGHSCHVHYLPTHQTSDPKENPGDWFDLYGFLQDTFRMFAVNDGCHTWTSYSIAQHWIDVLAKDPDKNYLHVCHSEGTTHVNAALRLIKEHKPELLIRIRIIAFCPAYFMIPEDHIHDEDEALRPQIVAFYKEEDMIASVAGRHVVEKGADHPRVHIVKHKDEHDPHDFWSPDYVKVAKPFFDKFIADGNIY